ncbi:hypothetical protein F5B17DRAFT_397910 [Nemania serpens]|nr:hypothetical protein F5B17DRAFT_397910 [Nemania serpens]
MVHWWVSCRVVFCGLAVATFIPPYVGKQPRYEVGISPRLTCLRDNSTGRYSLIPHTLAAKRSSAYSLLPYTIISVKLEFASTMWS